MSALSSHLIDEIKALPARYPQPRSAVMPALDLAQEELGHLTPEAMSEVAVALQLDPGYVEGVATFYSLFHLEPIGRHRFYMCTNLSCALRGANEMVCPDEVRDAAPRAAVTGWAPSKRRVTRVIHRLRGPYRGWTRLT